MNFTGTRIFAGLAIRLNTNKFPSGGKVYLLACNDYFRKDLCRTKVVRYNPSKVVMNRDDYNQNQKDGPIGAFGYCLLAIPVISFFLGTWQVQRRKWKLALIDDLKKRFSSEPIELPENLEELKDKEYCPVKVRGRFLYDKEFTIGPKSLIIGGAGASESGGGLFGNRSNIGYYVITPFQLEDRDLTILVNRGWVPTTYKDPQKKKTTQIDGVLDITGVVRLNENRPPFIPGNTPEKGVWLYRDINAMAEMTGASPVFIDLMTKDNPPGAPISCQTKITLRNEHLSYLITWYSLSAITGWMWYRLFIQRLPLL